MKYSDLDVWQGAMVLAEDVYRLTDRFPAHQRYVLSAQMQRAATSVPSNIAEGHGRKSTGAYLNHLSIASGSLRELQTQLELSRRLELIVPADAERLLGQCDKVGALLGALIRALDVRGKAPQSLNPES
jgi:four helix bundle protein